MAKDLKFFYLNKRYVCFDDSTVQNNEEYLLDCNSRLTHCPTAESAQTLLLQLHFTLK